jgi:hypothetical protein
MVWYNRGKYLFLYGSGAAAEPPFEFNTDLIKVGLMKASYTFATTHNVWTDASGDEIVASNYTARGDALALAGKTATEVDGSNLAKWDATDHTYTGLGNGSNDTLSEIIIMRAPDAGESSANTELLAHTTVGSTLTNGGDITLVWAAGGILQLTGS